MAKDQTDNTYFRRYGFENDPFDDAFDPRHYYISAEIQHRLELLKHLLEFSQQVLLVKGPQRAGKTTFLDYLVGTLEENWVVSRVSGDEIQGPDSLIRAIIGPGEEKQASDGESISALNRYLTYCDNRSMIPLVIIDNAAQLSKTTLDFVFQLINFKEAETYIRVVVLGEEKIAEELNRIAAEQSDSDPIHAINLPALTIEQTLEFLNQRLGGEEKRAPLIPEKEVQRIHKVSAGIIGDVMFLARQGLINPATDEAPASRNNDASKASKKPVTLLTILVPTVLIAAAISFLFLGDDKNDAGQQPRTVSLELPAPQQEKKQDTTPAAAETVKVTPELPDSWMEENEEQLAQLEMQAKAQAQTLQQESEAIVEPPSTLPATEAVAETVTEEAASTSQQPAGEIVLPNTGAGEESSTGSPERFGLRDESWLAGQDAQHYVLQLMRALEKKTVLTFIAEAGLNKSKLSLYESTRAGKSWYVLDYGLYPDIESARQAVPSLPAGVRAAKPWPKQISAIQAEIDGR